MDFNEKINKLRTEIAKALIPVIDNDYVLLGLPYYDNVGDVLIWEGTENFLRTLSHKCLKRASIDTFDFGILDSNVIILLQGGGNFGDIWIEHQAFRLKIIEKYPQNKIVILT